MLYYLRVAFLWSLVIMFLSCKKDEVVNNEDNFIEQVAELSPLEAEVSGASDHHIEVKWKAGVHTHFKAVTYNVYLDEKKIADGLTTTKYSLINLEAGKNYAIKIVASTSDGKTVQQILQASTLASLNSGTQTKIYKEYKIHAYSRLTGNASLKKCADGGHLVVRFLQHPDYFAEGAYNLIIFKIDRSGNMLWYKLLPASAYNLSPDDLLNIELHNEGKECLIFIKGYAFKVSTTNGELLLEKDFRSDLNGQFFQAVFYSSTQQILAGTNRGMLLSINPQNLTANWIQSNTGKPGTIVAIKEDSRKNIYYIFRDQNDRTVVSGYINVTPMGCLLPIFCLMVHFRTSIIGGFG